MAGEIDTTNRFGVGARGDFIILMKFGVRLSVDDAYNLAAYLVAMAESVTLSKLRGDEVSVSGETDFDAWLNAVRNT